MRWALGQHLSTLVVLVLLGMTIAGRGFGAYTAPRTSAAAEGGVPLLIRGEDLYSPKEAYAFAAAPMTVVQRRLPTNTPEDIAPPTPEIAEAPLCRAVITYTVRAGDSIESIAAEHDIAPYTIFWVNDLRTTDDIAPEMVLTVPPLSGVPHVVQAGETVDSIADMYGVRPGNIVGYPPNKLKYPYTLEAGQEIFVPGGVVEIPRYAVEDASDRPPPTLVQMPGGEKMCWPTWGYLSAPFGWSRAYGGYHRGIDIANSWGTPIYAAAAGTVIEAGWGSLGYFVKIDHGYGFRTTYGHLAGRPLVSAGEEVGKGQIIAHMGRTYGSSGYASGVHLHFAVQHHGVYIDPLPLLER